MGSFQGRNSFSLSTSVPVIIQTQTSKWLTGLLKQVHSDFQLLHILFWKGWSPCIIELIWLINMIFYWYWKHINLH